MMGGDATASWNGDPEIGAGEVGSLPISKVATLLIEVVGQPSASGRNHVELHVISHMIHIGVLMLWHRSQWVSSLNSAEIIHIKIELVKS